VTEYVCWLGKLSRGCLVTVYVVGLYRTPHCMSNEGAALKMNNNLM
jgi:hypothetical protein